MMLPHATIIPNEPPLTSILRGIVTNLLVCMVVYSPTTNPNMPPIAAPEMNPLMKLLWVACILLLSILHFRALADSLIAD
jgi:hypothetical protein